MINKIITFYNRYIVELWEILDNYFSGIMTNLQIQFTKKRRIRIAKRWEIFLVNFGVNIWSEYNKIRPGVVISWNGINKWNTIIVIPLTSKSKRLFLYDIEINNKQNSYQESVIKTSHIKNIDKKRLIKKIWNLENSVIAEIENQIILMLTKKLIPSKEQAICLS